MVFLLCVKVMCHMGSIYHHYYRTGYVTEPGMVYASTFVFVAC